MEKIVSCAIIGFWLVMMTLFVRKEILPTIPHLSEPSYKIMLKNRLPDQDTPSQDTMGIYFLDKRIGSTTTEVHRLSDNGYKITNKTEVNLSSLAGSSIPIKISGYSLINQNYQLSSFKFHIKMAFLTYTVTGRVEGKELKLTTTDGKSIHTRTIEFKPQATLSNGLSPFISMPHLSVGKEWHINMIDPLSGKLETLKAWVESKDTIEWQGTMHEVYEVVLNYKGFQPRAWISLDGRILKEEVMPQLYLIREE